ncbi:MAG: hypothetical protein KDK70_33380, partial [Myxococcales bacterium]|nr:hypothetical protein [Myxococcales bacterium]
ARMAKFMRELFSEEIRQTTLMLSDRLDDQPTMRRPALSREMLEAAGLPPIPAPPGEPESVELTPSEVRADQVMATPGPVEATYATDVTYEERKPSYVAVVLAVITGMIAVLGVASFVWFFVLADEKPGKKKDGEQDRTPAVIVESPSPEQPEPEPEPEPEPVGADTDVLEPGGDEEVGPAAAGSTGAAAEPDPEPEDDTGATESSTDPKDDKTGDADDSPKRGGSKRGGKRGGTKGTSGSKPKWDPDSPFPI